MNLQWPAAAKKAMSVFFVKWNDIDVYVEDTAGHADSLYTSLINRVLDGKAKIEKIFPLGGRKNVVDACRSDSGGKLQRPRIYLIDGDLDLISGINKVELPRLFQHEVYAIENYLISKDALIEILQEENPRYSTDEVDKILNYDKWIESICGLNELFVIFGATFVINRELPTISIPVNDFVSGGKRPCLDAEKIRKFISKRKTELLNSTSQVHLSEVIKNVEKRLADASDPLDLLAARDYVFPLLRFWVASVGLTLKSSSETLQIRLAKCVCLERHSKFCCAIKNTAAGKH